MNETLTADFCDVSVIMPAYKSATTIERALLSVAAQTLKPREVVVVDDGSDDGTFELAQSLRDRMQGIQLKVFRQENQGPGAARNRALAEAEGYYVAFLDSDDEWLPEKLRRSLEVIKAGDYALVSHDGWEVRGSEETPLEGSKRFEASLDKYHGLYRRGFIDNCAVVVRRDLVMAVGGFDASLPVGQDFDLQLKILADPAHKFTVFSDPLVRYFIIPGSVTSHTQRRLDCQMRILKRHAKHLKNHSGSYYGSIIFRTLAVHKEAITAFLAKGQLLKALGIFVSMPIKICSVLCFSFGK